MGDFDGLFLRLSGDMRGIAHKMDSGLGFADEADLFQEELAYLWESFNNGKLEDKTDSYILQGCFFHLKNYLRPKDKSTRFVSLDTARLVLSKDSVSVFYSENERGISANDVIEGLFGREKEVAALMAQGLTTREIGARLNISHVMVVKIMKKIRNKFKN